MCFANQLSLNLESRPVSVPVKAVLRVHEECRSPEDKMKEFIAILWNAVKSLTPVSYTHLTLPTKLEV